MKKKVTKKVIKKTTKAKTTPKKVVAKKEAKPKKKKEHLCFSCLTEIDPLLLKWVHVKNWLGMEFNISLCEKCIKKDKSKYEIFEVGEPCHKKRVYKKRVKKDAQ